MRPLNLILQQLLLTFILITLNGFTHAQETEINNNFICLNCPTSGIDQSAIFQINTIDKGVLMPRISDITVIANPHEALLVYDLSSKSFKYFDGSIWQNLGPFNLPIRFEDINNSFAGELSALANTTGSDNTTLGYYALGFNTTGNENTAIGSSALKNNVTGDHNTAIGSHSLHNITDQSNNVAVGDSTLFYNGTNASATYQGSNNVAIGSKALLFNETGFGNAALGTDALYSNLTGTFNTALGHHALKSNTSGSNNLAIGPAALLDNTTGLNNIAIGSNALLKNLSGNDNIAIGFVTANRLVSGFANIAIGGESFQGATEGSANVAIGYQAMRSGQGGSGNTAIGAAAMFLSDSLNNATGIGAAAIATASNQVVIGNSSVTEIGGYTNWSNLSDARFKSNIRNDIPGLAFIKHLNPVSYQLETEKIADFLGHPKELRSEKSLKKKSEIRQTGLIAQEVEKVANSLGYAFSGINRPQNDNDHYSLRYAEFVVPLVKAVQELNEELVDLKKENAEMKVRILRMEAMLKIKNE